MEPHLLLLSLFSPVLLNTSYDVDGMTWIAVRREGRGSALRDLEGLQVTIDGSLATVTGLDFARWDLRPGSGPQQQQPESITQAPSAADVR